MAANLHPPFGAFLHSQAWENLERSLGKEVRRLNIHTPDGDLSGLAIKERLPLLGEAWYLPKGPMFSGNIAWATRTLKEQFSGSGLVVCEPLVPLPGSRPTKMWQPSHTTVVSITGSATERLARMKPKTRYNIKVAAKHGVTVRLVDAAEGFPLFFKLLQETALRDGFHLHPESRYRVQAELAGDAVARLALAEAGGQVLAAGLWLDCAGVRTYLHGASSSLNRDYMAPYALHDFMMTEGATRGLLAYDFWGVAPPGQATHPLAGVTRFKEGFGGERLAMPGTFEIPLAPVRYFTYQAARSLKNLLKR